MPTLSLVQQEQQHNYSIMTTGDCRIHHKHPPLAGKGSNYKVTDDSACLAALWRQLDNAKNTGARSPLEPPAMKHQSEASRVEQHPSPSPEVKEARDTARHGASTGPLRTS